MQDDPARPAVFIAGGIGITPFLSMIRHAIHCGLEQQITLFYSNRDPDAAAFLGELEDLESSNPNFRMIATMTELQDDGARWNGETGFVDQEMLARHLPDLHAPIYYCVGPPPMIESTTEMLASAGVADRDMITEAFTGY
ncbi:MAG: FAD-dependent oxidoreductase [Alphaproteobacteria bacterium]|nr:FAD-dependent oxidoreductase [Alphaproteobacteria bacterium]